MKYPLITDEQRGREYLLEFVLLAVALSLAINLVSGLISEWAGNVIPGVVGMVICVCCMGAIAFLRLRRRSAVLTPRAVFVLDKQGNPVSIPGYTFGYDFSKLAKAVFAENEAFKRQWEDTARKDETWRDGQDRGRHRLIREISEYVLLEQIGIHVRGYFDEGEFSEDRLQRFTRESIPEVLLRNRVLELVSRDLRDRPAFADGASDDRPGRNVIYQSGPGGYFHRFELTLPKGSKVLRKEDGSIVLENRAVRLEVSVDFEGFATYLDSDFCRFMIRRPFNTVRPMKMRICIQARLKWPFLLTRRNRAYHGWLESLLASLQGSIDVDTFMERVGWSQSGPLLAALTKHMESPIPTFYGRSEEPENEAAEPNGAQRVIQKSATRPASSAARPPSAIGGQRATTTDGSGGRAEQH